MRLLLVLALLLALSSRADKPIRILVWSTLSNFPWVNQTRFTTARGHTCEVTMDRSEIQTADVVSMAWYKTHDFPPHERRPSGALWVYQNKEPSSRWFYRNPVLLASTGRQINVLMSYEHQSTLHAPYGMYRERNATLHAIPEHILMNRTHAAVIIESNCDSSNRNGKIALLQKAGLGIDMYGECGTLKHKECDARDPDCFRIIARQYYFYVAFENSDCPDYVTEKVWRNSLDAGMVPIVWSTVVDYKGMLPPHSYVNVADYPSVEEFVKVLYELVKFPHMYARYHDWRRTYAVHEYPNKYISSLICEYAITNNRREIPSIPGIKRIRTCPAQ